MIAATTIIIPATFDLEKNLESTFAPSNGPFPSRHESFFEINAKKEKVEDSQAYRVICTMFDGAEFPVIVGYPVATVLPTTF